ncbi:tetratricopeptide repeat protein [Aetokthonos hydrillicola]|jgi:tetratricopeptide (TPR) repeat protein|uniref:tetratricopeptide repeat protein n=1 Tax=Aetokthonos hydrillicola TaxID=1550245 RepID=UPI001ABB4D10|nr:tetratricopeptide repeat protein [Aetokthonos hydrillicola]MBO3458151.1 tetratricopeptide repeat protein [Aetokthonos hydrillicola CCALA 1050]MBW4584371.1 tetratricopeptide repeat protein [Aetokthonos hydrillicola CCALA 1050]
MSLTFSFALTQNQTFELRCENGSRRLDSVELSKLIDVCEKNYYPRHQDSTPELIQLGQRLYHWLDGKEGWLRRALDQADEGTIYLDLSQTNEAQGLNPDTERMALGLAHLPWELLHDGTVFLLTRQDIAVLPVRCMQQRNTRVIGEQNRPLRLLFMATAPEDPKVAPLAFEQEEANILEATKDQPLALIVEESGSVDELKNLVASYQEDYFDVFHITGHGLIYTKNYSFLLRPGQTIPDHTPCLLTEDEVGNVKLTTVNDLAKAFRGRWSKVIFLSGCHTGEVANKGTVPSMAQQLVKAGAGVVLGWARPVYDRTGIIAAQALYHALATGDTIEQAVKVAQQEMIAQKCTDWHLLRIYRDTRPIEKLVTPLRTRGREKLVFTPPEQEFLDENNIVKVASRSEFVGRRRALQRCLQALRQTSEQIGVFIAGMGGLGKSSLAARLCTRVRSQRQEFQQVVLVGTLDKAGLLNKLAGKYERFADVPALLNEPKVSLKGRLQNFFDAIETTHNQPLLLVLDDFEQNIPKANIENGSLRMTAQAYQILEAICAALAENNAVSRLIVTCRYLQEDTLPPHRLHLEKLAAMSRSDIDKICRPLGKENQQQGMTQRVIKIADGNPRLLKWLLEVIEQPSLEPDDLLTRLEAVEQKFRENILAQTLLDALEVEEKKFLARLSVFQLPVTEDIISATEQNLTPAEGSVRLSLNKLTSLSLVESATTHPSQTPTYRVTTILEPLLEQVLDQVEWQTTRQQGVRKIYQLWWEESENRTEAQVLEIVRLGLLAKEQEIAVRVGNAIAMNWVNSSRFLEVSELCQQILKVYEDYRILGAIARAEQVLGLVEDAAHHYQQALELCPQEDVKKKSSIIHNMAGLIAQQGEISKALALYEQSLQIKESINDVRGKATTLHNMASLLAQQGEIPRALALYEQSLQIKESINDVRGKAATLHQMAFLLAQQGEIPRALALYEQSLQIEESVNNVGGKAATLHQMAFLLAHQGEIPRALALYEQSLQIKENINDVRGKAATLHQMAGLLAQQGEIPKALTLYEQSLQIEESINNVGGKAATLHQMAFLLAQQGETPRALALYEQSLQIEESINNVRGKATTLHNMAFLLAQQGEILTAITFYEQSLQIYESINDVRGKATTLHSMAGLLAKHGEITRAIRLYEQSLQIEESINDVRGKAATLAYTAYLAGETGDKARELDLYLQVAATLAQIRAYVDLVTVLGNLGLADESKNLVYFAQAIWLTLRIQAPPASTINLIRYLYNHVPKGEELEALLGATAMFFCNYRGEGHPQLEELRDVSRKMIAGAAGRQGIQTQEAFETWWTQQRLNDPEYFLPQLNQRLEEIVGDGWVFDREWV